MRPNKGRRIGCLKIAQVKSEIREKCRVIMDRPLENLIEALDNKVYALGYTQGYEDAYYSGFQDAITDMLEEVTKGTARPSRAAIERMLCDLKLPSDRNTVVRSGE